MKKNNKQIIPELMEFKLLKKKIIKSPRRFMLSIVMILLSFNYILHHLMNQGYRKTVICILYLYIISFILYLVDASCFYIRVEQESIRISLDFLTVYYRKLFLYIIFTQIILGALCYKTNFRISFRNFFEVDIYWFIGNPWSGLKLLPKMTPEIIKLSLATSVFYFSGVEYCHFQNGVLLQENLQVLHSEGKLTTEVYNKLSRYSGDLARSYIVNPLVLELKSSSTTATLNFVFTEKLSCIFNAGNNLVDSEVTYRLLHLDHYLEKCSHVEPVDLSIFSSDQPIVVSETQKNIILGEE